MDLFIQFIWCIGRNQLKNLWRYNQTQLQYSGVLWGRTPWKIEGNFPSANLNFFTQSRGRLFFSMGGGGGGGVKTLVIESLFFCASREISLTFRKYGAKKSRVGKKRILRGGGGKYLPTLTEIKIIGARRARLLFLYIFFPIILSLKELSINYILSCVHLYIPT